MIASGTRLRLRSVRHLLPFLVQVWRIRRQLADCPGNLGLKLRKTRGLAFWTQTLWRDPEALAAFQSSGAHQRGKPRLPRWCDEAVHAHWEVDDAVLPGWPAVEEGLARHGRLSALDHPSPEHAAGRIPLS